MNLMFYYVDLNSAISLGYIIFCLYHLYIIKHMLLIFTSKGHFHYSQ